MKEIYERRSIRKFKSDEVSHEICNKLIMAAMKAPSAKNRQPWNFTVLTSVAKKKFVDVMRSGIEKEKAQAKILPQSANFIPAALNTVDIMEQAPVLITIHNPAGKTVYENLSPEEKIYERSDIQSIGAAIENMLLEASSLGLGSLWICDVYFAYDELNALYKDKGEIIAAVSIGYPDEFPAERPRKEFSSVTEFLSE